MKRSTHPGILASLVAAAILLGGCGQEMPAETLPVAATAEVPAAPLPEPYVYVSLGDSIARGYGLADVAAERYSKIAADAWETEHEYVVQEYNYGIDGLTSMGLLEQLSDGLPQGIEDAEVVSVSIGANNVLRSFTQFLYDYYLYLYAEPAQLTDDEIAEKFRAFTTDADAGIVQLGEDLPQLVAAIRAVNPDCEILFLDLYNPYAAVNTELVIDGLPISMAAMSDTYVRKIGQCLRETLDGEENIQILDIHGAFAGREGELVCAVTPPDMDPRELDMSRMDPHPNAKGHMVLGKLVADAFPEK